MIACAFHPAAEVELTVAAEYYEARVVGLGRLFVEAAERGLSLLQSYPDLGTPIDQVRRRLPIRGYPYSVVYRQDGQVIYILAIAHQARRPRYWAQREV